MNIVYVSGFGSGRFSAEGTGERLATAVGASDVETFTFSDRKRRMSRLIKAMRTASRTYTHSAGIIPACKAIENGEIEGVDISMFNAPVPRSAGQLVVNGFPIAWNMLKDAKEKPSILLPTVEFGVSYALEMMLHPLANMGALFYGEPKIPDFDSTKAAIHLKTQGHEPSVIDTYDDEYFRRDPDSNRLLKQNGIKRSFLLGHHNRLAVDTAAVISELQ